MAALSTIVSIRFGKHLHKSVRFKALANTIVIFEIMIIRSC